MNSIPASVISLVAEYARWIRVAIVGTAGRREDGSKMNAELFDTMIETARSTILTRWNLAPDCVCLVSGGAAWSDHVAVRLAPEFAALQIHLPCTMTESGRALDTGSRDWRTNPGWLMNHLHQSFSVKLGRDTLRELCVALRNNPAKIYSGFHTRNAQIANSDYLVAFSWSDTSEPKDGGTLFTWNLFKKKQINPRRRIHLSLMRSGQHHPLKKRKFFSTEKKQKQKKQNG